MRLSERKLQLLCLHAGCSAEPAYGGLRWDSTGTAMCSTGRALGMRSQGNTEVTHSIANSPARQENPSTTSDTVKSHAHLTGTRLHLRTEVFTESQDGSQLEETTVGHLVQPP